MNNTKTNILILLFGLIAIAIFMGVPFTGSPTITMSKYNQIRPGMSYDQTVNIIGKSGVEVSSNQFPVVPGVMSSIQTVMYQWVNLGGSNMNALFQNDKLVSKAQFGLQ